MSISALMAEDFNHGRVTIAGARLGEEGDDALELTGGTGLAAGEREVGCYWAAAGCAGGEKRWAEGVCCLRPALFYFFFLFFFSIF